LAGSNPSGPGKTPSWEVVPQVRVFAWKWQGLSNLLKEENAPMLPEEAKAEVFWLAFKGLAKKEQQLIVERLLHDPEFVNDLLDIAIIEQRRSEPSRPLEEYLADS
jgi:hypothetical protein